jgi:hypothetical protein
MRPLVSWFGIERVFVVLIRDCCGKEPLGGQVARVQGKDGEAVSVRRWSTLTVLRQANDVDIELQPLPGLEVFLLLQ